MAFLVVHFCVGFAAATILEEIFKSRDSQNKRQWDNRDNLGKRTKSRNEIEDHWGKVVSIRI